MRPKKIILVVIDSLRKDHLGCYGYKRNTSPNIDALAKSGIMFKHAFSVCPNTVPSIASILTSKYPSNHSMGFNLEGKLDPEADSTLAVILKENKYRTAAFLGSAGITGLNPGFDQFDEGEGRRDCTATNEQVLKWLGENHTQDFFLLVHYSDLQGPYLNSGSYKNAFVEDEFYGNAEYISKISDKELEFNSISRSQLLNPVIDADNNLVGFETDVRYYKAQYDGCIRNIDENIQMLIEKLKILNIFDDCLIILTSDHGEALGENNIYFNHGPSVTLDQIAVPLVIMHGKDYIPGVMDVQVSTIDIMPTVLSLCGIGGRDFEGSGLEKIIDGKEDALLQERTLSSENEQQYVLIRPDRLMEFKKKDVPDSKFYPVIPALMDSLLGKRYYWDSGNEYLLTLPFDQYQRYKIVADIINKFRKDKQIFKIIEVGAGFEEILKKFLPYDDIYFFDKDLPQEYRQKSNYIMGDFLNVGLDETYDFVISIDAYEHIHPNSREKFLTNVIQLSSIATILAAPFDTPGVRENEILANETYKVTHGIEFKWLHEHIQNGLPSLPYTLELIKKSGLGFIVIPNGYLSRWFEMISIYLLTENIPDFYTTIKELYEFYNKNFYCYDNLAPSYRQVIIINKISNRKFDLSGISGKNPEIDGNFNIKYKMLQLLLKNIIDIYDIYKSRELSEKNARITQLTSQIDELNSTIQDQSGQINLLNGTLQEKSIQIIQLNSALQERNVQIVNLNSIIQSMRQSIVWQVLMKFDRVIEYIFPQDTKRRKYYTLGLMYGRIAIKEGLRSSWRKYKDDKKVHNTLYKNNIVIPKLDIKIANSIEDIETIQKDVSIIIPTKNAGLDFEFTLEKIRSQKGMKNIEIIIVDSGSNDDTIKLAQKYGSIVYIIKPEEFNHGATRNFGAEKATGDYVLFLVQDAIPIGEYWLYNMVKVLENDDKIAAASCRQVPRSDAELFTCSLLWNHSRMLGLNEDRLSSLSQNFNDLSIIEKRKIAGLEDVCCLLRKEIFDDLKFKNIKYAEDLELGIRILENKYKIAYLFSVGVIHSHNRTPIYFLKRSYVDNKILPGILSYEPYYFTQNYKDIYEVISDIMISYMVLNASIESLKSISFNNNATELISKFRSFIQVNSKKDYYELKKFDHGNISLDDFFDEQQKKVSIINTTSKDLLITNFFYLVEDFRLYSKLYPSMNYKKEEFIVDLYKLFSLAAGSMLANYYLFKSRGTEIDDKLSGIDSILSRGI